MNAALGLRKRIGHLHVPGNDVDCPECNEGKGQRKAVKRYRVPEHVVPEPMEQLNADYWGPVKPISTRNNKLLFVVIDDASAYLWATPLKSKDMAAEAIKTIIDGILPRDAVYDGQKIVYRVRTDNEPSLRERPWQAALKSRNVEPMHSTPYLPQQNGVAERMMRTIGDSLKAILIGVDKVVWDYAAEYFAWAWNRVPRANYARLPWAKDLSPAEIRIKTRERRAKSSSVPPGPLPRPFGEGRPVIDEVDLNDQN